MVVTAHIMASSILQCEVFLIDLSRQIGEYCRNLRVLLVRECRDINEISLSRLRVRGVKMDVNPPGQYGVDFLTRVNYPKLHLQI